MDVPTMIVISPEGSTLLRVVGRCCLLVVATMAAVRA
jgi:hypothetical protein